MGKNKEVEVDGESEAKSLRATIKEGSSFSWSKVIITALAAVTVAVISSQLNSIVNSILLVALLSIISAIINEGYRIFAIVAKVGAKKVADPLLSNVPILSGDKNEEDLAVTIEPNTETGALEIVKVSKSITTDTKVLDVIGDELQKGEELWQLPDGSLVRASELDEIDRLKTAAFNVIKSAVGLKKPETSTEGKPKTWWRVVRDFIAARPGMKLIVFFTIVAMVAVGASYAVTSRIEANNYTTINRPVVELSAEEKQELVDKAVDEAVAEAVAKAVSQSAASDEKLSSLTEGNMNTLELAMSSMEARIVELENFLNTAAAERANLTNEITQLKKLVDELKLELAATEASVVE